MNTLSQLLITEGEKLTNLVSVAVGADGPQDDLRPRGDSHHLVVVSQRARHHLGVERDSVDHPIQTRRREDLLPPGRLLHPDGQTDGKFDV